MSRRVDPYRLLNVSPGAGIEEIRAAFRRAVLACHPDRRPNDPARAAREFREVCRAYRLVLADRRPVMTPRQAACQDLRWRTQPPRRRTIRLGDPEPLEPTDVPGVVFQVRPRVDEPAVFLMCLAGAALAGLAATIPALAAFQSHAARTPPLGESLLLAGGIYLLIAAAAYAALIASRTVVRLLSHLYWHGRLTLPAPPGR